LPLLFVPMSASRRRHATWTHDEIGAGSSRMNMQGHVCDVQAPPAARGRVRARMALLSKPHSVLALEDGTVYKGYAFGSRGKSVGEIVFNTSMTGYQEILTDPSYHGQIVTMTYHHIGNYGVSVYDVELTRQYARGFT